MAEQLRIDFETEELRDIFITWFLDCGGEDGYHEYIDAWDGNGAIINYNKPDEVNEFPILEVLEAKSD